MLPSPAAGGQDRPALASSFIRLDMADGSCRDPGIGRAARAHRSRCQRPVWRTPHTSPNATTARRIRGAAARPAAIHAGRDLLLQQQPRERRPGELTALVCVKNPRLAVPGQRPRTASMQNFASSVTDRFHATTRRPYQTTTAARWTKSRPIGMGVMSIAPIWRQVLPRPIHHQVAPQIRTDSSPRCRLGLVRPPIQRLDAHPAHERRHRG